MSVHEWSTNGNNYAFDIDYNDGNLKLSLIARNNSNYQKLQESLLLESISFTTTQNRPNRLILGSVPSANFDDEEIQPLLEIIRSSRRAIELNCHDRLEFIDNEFGNHVSYAVKKERKSCRELIFLFTSIRTRKHWIDFDGPLGQTLSTNRSRIVFIYDSASEFYNYHFAISGTTEIFNSTINFIRDYVDKHQYSWSEVTLAGMSKGGTAAIMLGTILPGTNVLALAPQLALGNYLLRSKRSKIIKQMSGMESLAGAKKIDELMWKVLADDSTGMSQCTVLTSVHDEDCISELSKFHEICIAKNVALGILIDRSEHTSTHLKTVHHLMPTFVSILGSIAGGLRPKI